MTVVRVALVAAAVVLGLAGRALSCCDVPPGAETNLANHGPLAALIAKADAVELYEGLPHPMWEKELLAKEKQAKKTVEMHGFAFYASPIEPKGADAGQLAKVLADAASLRKFAGEKRCGGFHPDWYIEWRAGDEVVQCLVCFGCGEVKFYGSAASLHADMTQASAKALAATLAQYQKQRPPRAKRSAADAGAIAETSK